ncbi:PAS domain S-box protein [Flavobacteriaceae bacterium]|nr:PAS domain S-box protein [Flavobacteriaceae bacterium]
MGIRKKLVISFVVIINILVAEIFLNQIISNNATDTYLKLKTEAFPAMRTLDKYESINRELYLLVSNKVNNTFISVDEKNRINGIIEIELPNLKGEIHFLQEKQLSHNLKVKSIGGVINRTDKLIKLVKKINRLLGSKEDYNNPIKRQLSVSVFNGELSSNYLSLQSELEGLKVSYTTLFEDYQKEISERLKSLSNVILITGVLGVLIAISISYRIIRSITKPISQLKRAAYKVSTGNYDVKLDIEGQDELSLLAISFNTMVSSLNRNFKLIEKNNIEIKEQEERFKLIIASSPQAMVLFNHKEEVVLLNHKAEELLGYGNKELLNCNLEVLIPQKLRSKDIKKKNKYFSNLRQYIEDNDDMSIVRKNGEEFPVEIALASTKSKGEVLKIATIIDVTERKQQENKIELYLQELELKNKNLQEFTYITSHDLQEPLRTVTSFITLLKEECSEALGANGGIYVDFMQESTTRMSDLIKGLLEHSRIGMRSDLSLVDCNEVLDSIKVDLGTAIAERGAKVKVVSNLPVINGYQMEIRMLFQNLISNSMKFCPLDRSPEIDVSFKEKNDCWIFNVKDNGIGIDKAHAEKIFIIFQQLHDRVDYEGTGIGLAHCKKIAELHKGQIWVESTLGEGSSFFIKISKKLS